MSETAADGEEPTTRTARPAESRRDPEATRVDLESWLAGRLPSGAEPVVGSVTVPDSNGMSSETVLVDATWTEDGERSDRRLVARIAPAATTVPVFETYDLASQYRVMAVVGERSDVPVPPVLWLEEDDGPIGAPFFTMERHDGVVPPDVLPYDFGDNWLYDASARTSSDSRTPTVDVLVALHGIEDPEQHFAFLASTAPGDTALRRHVADLRRYFDWVSSDGHRSPLIESCFDWLDAQLAHRRGADGAELGRRPDRQRHLRRLRARRGARLGDGRARAPRAGPGLDDLPAPLLRGHRHVDGTRWDAALPAP